MEIDMPSRSSVRTLASAIAAVFVTAFAPPPSLAQTTPSSQYQVLEFDYAPATPTPGLDLRPGRYLLQLRRDPSGNYEGLLRGPRNEIVAERLQFSASSGCGTNPPANAVLSTRALPAQRGLNVLHLEVVEGTGSCTLSGELPNLGFTLPEKPPQWLECEQPTEIEETGARDPGPVCNVEEWEPPLAAPRPDLEPGPVIVFGGKQTRWSDGVRVYARDAHARLQGRCVFEYTYSIGNTGRAESAYTDASLLLEHRFGLQLDVVPLPALSVAGVQRVRGRVALPAGTWRIFAHADASALVAEQNGQNNARSLIVEVAPDCSVPAAQ